MDAIKKTITLIQKKGLAGALASAVFEKEPTFRAAADKVQYLNAVLGQKTLASFLSYRLFDETNHLFLNVDSIGFTVQASTLIGEGEAPKNLVNLIDNILPEGASAHFLLIASQKVGGILDAWEKARTKRGSLFATLAKKRVSFLKRGVRGSLLKSGDYPVRDFKLFISFTFPVDTSPRNCLSIQEGVLRTLKSCGFQTKLLNPIGLLNIVNELLYPDTKSYPVSSGWDERHTLHEQCVRPDTILQVTPNGVQVNDGETEIRMFSVANYPQKEVWPLSAMQELIGDPFFETQRIGCPFFLSLIVHVPHQAKHKRNAAQRLLRANQLVGTPAVRIMPELVDIAAERKDFSQWLEKGGRAVQMSYQIGLYAAPDKMTTFQTALQSLFVTKGWSLYEHKCIHLPLLMASLPMVHTPALLEDLGRQGVVRKMPSYVVGQIAPVQGEWKGMAIPRVMLIGRRGQLLWFDPFSNREGNYNVCVVGKSGSGKSVLMQEMAASIVGSGGRMWVIDSGRSFESMCKFLEGSFIEFTPDKIPSLNPFCGINALDEDRVSMLKSLLEQMAAPRDPISDAQRSLLEQAIIASWKATHQKTTITNISEWLLSQESAIAQDLGTRLYSYTKDGMYGPYFESQTPNDLENPFVVMELGELKNKGDLRLIALMVLMFQVTEAMFKGDRTQAMSLMIDEAWDLLRGDKIKDFMENVARVARKYEGNIISGTQNAADYYNNPAAMAIWANSDFKIVLSQLESSIALMKEDKRLPMSPYIEMLLKSLRTVLGEYAEMVIFGPSSYAVGQFILDSYSLAMYSTKGAEFAAVKKLAAQGIPLETAIERVAEVLADGR